MPDRYTVIGHPVTHSKSPDIHTRFAAQTRQDLHYERLLAPLDGFNDTVRSFQEAGGKGANVTVPFKLEAYALSDSLTGRARAAGAVNTLKFEDGMILGDNTDGVGLVTDIVRNAGVMLRGRKVLVLGAGGAARGVLLPLLEQRPSQLVLVNRTRSKAEELALQFASEGKIVAGDFAGLSHVFDVVINATSASLQGDMLPVPPVVFSPTTFAYDMMYGKEPTAFMCFARQHGAAIRDGLGMLVEQAAESFFVWRGVRPDTAPVYDALRAGL